MKLTILGSGTAMPWLERSNAAYILEVDGRKLLLDSGAGTIRRLLEVKVGLLDIEDIFYTHLHNDHINDLGAIIWANNYGLKRKKPLYLYGPKGIRKYCNILMKKLLKPSKVYFDLKVTELKNSKLLIGNVHVETFQTKHSLSTRSVIYRFKHENKIFVYTGDTEYCEEAIKAAESADVLLAECSHPDNLKADGHLTPSLAGKIAAKAGVKTLILTHFYPAVLKSNIKKQCGKEFGGNIIVAKDKLSINI